MTWVHLMLEGDTSWHESAACRNADPRLFFSSRSDELDQAVEYCAVCPVVGACARDRALNDAIGIWGGKRWVHNGTRVALAAQQPQLREAAS